MQVYLGAHELCNIYRGGNALLFITDLHILGPYAGNDLPFRLVDPLELLLRLFAKHKFLSEYFDKVLSFFFQQHSIFKKVHLRRSDEARDKQVIRAVKDFLRRPYLLDKSVLHDDDSRAQRHRLRLIMRYVNEGGVEFLMQLYDLGAHLISHLGVEVGKRFVH